MEKVLEFRIKAEECRRLAKNADGVQLKSLLDMANYWSTLATERVKRIESGSTL